MKQAPQNLTKKTRHWWRQVMADYELEPHHVRLLTLAAQAFDRAEQARKILDAEGLTFFDRYDNPRARPEIAVERDSRLAYARLLRELSLDVQPPGESRPPGLIGRSHLRR